VTCRLLQSAGIDCSASRRTADVEARVREGIGALILTDILFAAGHVDGLLHAVAQQPPWSNLPMLILSSEARSPRIAATLQSLGNVTLLDRPTSPHALVSAVKAALRGRRWQYQIRDQLLELMQADMALRQADRRKDEFLATLAHELRNPLAPIKTGLQLMAHAGLAEDRFALTRDMMERQLTQLVKLIDQLLEVSRIATGKIVLERQALDLRDVVRSAVETCQPMLDAAGHQLAVTLPDVCVMVEGDATRLAQSVGNLLNNACKYTGPGGRIRVALSVDAGRAVLTVADNGSGIPPEMLDSVFDLFTQVNRTLDRAQGGLGIGLSLVKSLVTLHGGEVRAQSAGMGQGSTFTLRLPLAAPAALSPGRHPSDAPAAPLRALRVLIVDDNADAADSLAMLLEMLGHDTRVEYSGQAGLRAAVAFKPDVVFCDIGMPDMGGYEVASRLRRDGRFGAALLVAVTGWGAQEDKRRAKGAGFDMHLTKPVSAESVTGLLATAFRAG
jgi:signal transduction histidine kinase